MTRQRRGPSEASSSAALAAAAPVARGSVPHARYRRDWTRRRDGARGGGAAAAVVAEGLAAEAALAQLQRQEGSDAVGSRGPASSSLDGQVLPSSRGGLRCRRRDPRGAAPEPAPAPVWKRRWRWPGRCASFAVFCIGSFRKRTVVQEHLDLFMLVPIRDRRELEVDVNLMMSGWVSHSCKALDRIFSGAATKPTICVYGRLHT